MLRTPSDSALRLGPPGFRPVIRLEGKYVAISIVSDAAESALKAVKRKEWKPSDDVQRACERLPAKIVMLGLVDPREILPTVLASFPGTLQTMINAAVVLRSGMRAGGGNAPGGMNPQNRPGPGGMMGPGLVTGPPRPWGRVVGEAPGCPAPAMPGGPGGAPGGARGSRREQSRRLLRRNDRAEG